VAQSKRPHVVEFAPWNSAHSCQLSNARVELFTIELALSCLDGARRAVEFQPWAWRPMPRAASRTCRLAPLERLELGSRSSSWENRLLKK